MAYAFSIGNPRSNPVPTVQRSAKSLKLKRFYALPEWVFAGEMRRCRSCSADISTDAEISASDAVGDAELFHSGLQGRPSTVMNEKEMEPMTQGNENKVISPSTYFVQYHHFSMRLTNYYRCPYELKNVRTDSSG
jgi:hypothetical protein